MLFGTLVALAAVGAPQQVQPVKIVQVEKRFSLTRAGKPFFIRGVGGSGSPELLAAINGNSFRTWGAENLDKELALAQKNGLTVTAGIWLGHKRHGFDYSNPGMVAEQHRKALDVVRKFKDHPNLLIWALGNEVELDGDDPKAWKAINDLAHDVKRIDPNHPVMTVVAEIGGNKIEQLKKLCPEIDIVGINSYAGLASLPKRLAEVGWTKPYIVTEFGPPGPWEVGKTAWDAPFEPTSTQKAQIYRDNYTSGVLNQPQCLGAYAFLWGNKQEGTATWFGMMLPSGENTEAVDVLADLFGKPRKNRAPRIEKFESPVANTEIARGSQITASVVARDPDQDGLSYTWVLQSEQTHRGSGGDAEAVPDVLETKKGSTKVTFDAPTVPGGYRLFVFVSDGKGNAATGNLPLKIKG